MTWIIEDWNIVARALLTAVIMLSVVMIVTRINGLRSFAKITPIDFAVTVTIGSVINSTVISDSNSVLKGSLVIIVLLSMQTLFGWLKARFTWFDKTVFNQPLFLMRNGEFMDDNIDSSRISRENIVAKLRENGVAKLSDVRAVVLETTGDISVITGDEEIDEYIISDVRLSPDDGNLELENNNQKKDSIYHSDK